MAVTSAGQPAGPPEPGLQAGWRNSRSGMKTLAALPGKTLAIKTLALCNGRLQQKIPIGAVANSCLIAASLNSGVIPSFRGLL
jgi:hypothetical protein